MRNILEKSRRDGWVACLKREEGAEIVEFSLLATLMALPLFLGLYLLWRTYSLFEAADRAARKSARVTRATGGGWGIHLGRLWREGGSQVAEFGLVATFVALPLFLGIFSLGRAYSVYETVDRAAREGARVAVVRTCAACGNATATVSAVENAVLNTMAAASVKTSLIVIPKSCSGSLSSKICYQRDVTLDTGGTPTELGAVVALTYPVPISIPFTGIKGTINVTPSVQMREEN